jgi:hypothetical protein
LLAFLINLNPLLTLTSWLLLAAAQAVRTTLVQVQAEAEQVDTAHRLEPQEVALRRSLQLQLTYLLITQ